MSEKTLNIKPDISATDMAQSMFGAGVDLVEATFTGDDRSAGRFTNGQAAADVVPAETGVILSTGKAADFAGTNKSASISTRTKGVDGDAILDAMAGVDTYDGAIFEARFVPKGDVLTMRLTFGSEEYLEWVDVGFNDAAAITVNGTDAQPSIGDGEIAIDNINTTANANLFRDNATGTFSTEMDGITVVLTVKAPGRSRRRKHPAPRHRGCGRRPF